MKYAMEKIPKEWLKVDYMGPDTSFMQRKALH